MNDVCKRTGRKYKINYVSWYQSYARCVSKPRCSILKFGRVSREDGYLALQIEPLVGVDKRSEQPFPDETCATCQKDAPVAKRFPPAADDRVSSVQIACRQSGQRDSRSYASHELTAFKLANRFGDARRIEAMLSEQVLVGSAVIRKAIIYANPQYPQRKRFSCDFANRGAQPTQT